MQLTREAVQTQFKCHTILHHLRMYSDHTRIIRLYWAVISWLRSLKGGVLGEARKSLPPLPIHSKEFTGRILSIVLSELFPQKMSREITRIF